jgi:hypothetical protein
VNESNPYQAPSSAAPSPPIDNRNVKRVASAQRLVLLSLLANIGINVASYLISGQSVTIFYAFYALALVVVGFMIYSMFSLAKELNPTWLAVLYAILMVVPCVSLILLLVVNQQATGFLTSNGIKVGLMGASKKQFK